MAWTAEITSKTITRGRAKVVVTFTNGVTTFSREFLIGDPPSSWPASDIDHTLARLTRVESRLSGVSVASYTPPDVPPVEPPPPTEDDDPSEDIPVEPPPSNPTRQLLGGWRIPLEFARGGLAINFTTSDMWVVGVGDNGGNVYRFNFASTPYGTGSGGVGYGQWPMLQPVQTISPWWFGDPLGAGCYANSLAWWNGKLWAAPRKFYDTSPPATMKVIATDGTAIAYALGRQKYSGFIKRGPGVDPYIGCGGYESGQGSVSGPTLALQNATSKISYSWPASVGTNLANWNQRAPRPPNYWAEGHTDSWVAWEPRTVNGELQGRWACDVIYGGGIAIADEGIYYFATLGLNELKYSLQVTTFSNTKDMWTYKYSDSDFSFQSYSPLFFGEDVGTIGGQELGPDGKVYLAQTYAHKIGVYTVSPVVKVFG